MTATPDQTRTLDAAYQPFPSFQEWLSRTSVESARWSALVQKLREARAAASTLTSRALEVAKRAAAFDTGAIENLYETDRGFTYSVAFETGAWELGLLERGEQVRPLFEAQMHAYDFVLDLATGSEPISEAAIRRLHEIVCAAQDTYQVQTAVGPQNQPLPKGIYKALPNHVRTRTGEDHSYAPVDLTPAEMHRLVQELRTDEFTAAHPIQQAAYAHYCFVAIHPFADGNGRVARALASLYTYRAASAPIIILSEDKPRYLDALAEADSDSPQAFVDFMLAQSIDTLALVEDSLQPKDEQTLEEAITSLQQLVGQNITLTVKEIDRRAVLLRDLFIGALQNLFAAQPSIQAASAFTTDENPYQGPFRPLEGERAKALQFQISPRGTAARTVSRTFHLLVPLRADGLEEVLLATREGPTIRMALDDLARDSGFLKMRIDSQAERVAAHMITSLARKVRDPF